MTLPAYAEELKRAAAHEYDGTPFGRSASIVNCIDNNLDRILRDAEIAEATRRHYRALYRALYRATKSSARDIAHDDLYALIAKETP